MTHRIAVALLVLTASIASAQRIPELVRDISSGNVMHSNPRHFVSDGQTAYFFANDGDNGVELWKTDGTAAGTRMLSDIGPATSSYAYEALLFHDPAPMMSGDYVYFWAPSRPYVDLWRSDGTAAGTINLTKSLPDAFRTPPVTGRDKGRAVAFGAHGAVFTVPSGPYLCVTDGTREGTHRIEYDAPVFEEATFVASNGAVYFTNLRDLWRTDGTRAGTRRVAGLEIGEARVKQMMDSNGCLLYTSPSPRDS